jgi:hypothetical protein
MLKHHNYTLPYTTNLVLYIQTTTTQTEKRFTYIAFQILYGKDAVSYIALPTYKTQTSLP